MTGLYATGVTCSNKTGQVYTSSYDSWGNVRQHSYSGVTATLSYDSLDHFTQWNGGSTNQEWYVYDAGGNRVLKRTVGQGSTVLTSYPFGLEEHQFTGVGAANGGDKYYYSLGGQLIGELNGTTTQYFLVDGLGSPLGSISNVAGSAAIQGNQLYDPYGYRRYHSGTVGTSKQFTGQYNDAQTGLNYFNARYYDSIAGVFLSADEVQGNVEGMNPYGYVGGNPETASDPTGRMNLPIDGGGGGEIDQGGEGEGSGEGNGIAVGGDVPTDEKLTEGNQESVAAHVSEAANEVSSADAQALEADRSGLSTEIRQEKEFQQTKPTETESQTTVTESTETESRTTPSEPVRSSAHGNSEATALARQIYNTLDTNEAKLNHRVVAVGIRSDGVPLVALNQMSGEEIDQTAVILSRLAKTGRLPEDVYYVGSKSFQPVGANFDLLHHAEMMITRVTEDREYELLGIGSYPRSPCEICRDIIQYINPDLD